MIDTIQRLKNVAEFIGNTTGRENARWIYDVADELERLRSELQQAKGMVEKHRVALFMCAPSHQGGHSATGAAASEALGVPFPINMVELGAKAREEGRDTRALWPWSKTAHGTQSAHPKNCACDRCQCRPLKRSSSPPSTDGGRT